ncbi:hypothetical protein LXL04_022375 [Taraxacum kok-saghyz]
MEKLDGVREETAMGDVVWRNQVICDFSMTGGIFDGVVLFDVVKKIHNDNPPTSHIARGAELICFLSHLNIHIHYVLKLTLNFESHIAQTIKLCYVENATLAKFETEKVVINFLCNGRYNSFLWFYIICDREKKFGLLLPSIPAIAPVRSLRQHLDGIRLPITSVSVAVGVERDRCGIGFMPVLSLKRGDSVSLAFRVWSSVDSWIQMVIPQFHSPIELANWVDSHPVGRLVISKVESICMVTYRNALVFNPEKTKKQFIFDSIRDLSFNWFVSENHKVKIFLVD